MGRWRGDEVVRRRRAPAYIPGIDMTSNTAIELSPGVFRWGWSSRSVVTASRDSAWRIEKPVMCSSALPLAAPPTEDASPRGDPRSTIASPALADHRVQSSMPACICSGVAEPIILLAEVEDL